MTRDEMLRQPPTDEQIETSLRRIGTGRVRRCIPVEPDDDDVVLSNAIEALRSERDSALRERDEAREALRRLEWSFRQTALRNGGTIYTAIVCPACMGEKDPPDDKGSARRRGDPLPPAGHKRDCWLARALASRGEGDKR